MVNKVTRRSRNSRESTGTLVTIGSESSKRNEPRAGDGEAKAVFTTFMDEVLNHLDLSASGDNRVVVQGIDNYYLLCDDRPISITHLPLSIGGAAVRLSENSRPIHLLGQTRSGVGKIKLRAEMWKLWALGKSFGPQISIRTPNGWTRLYDQRPVYRRIMNDGLTLMHLLHFIERNPTASAVAIQLYLKEVFWKHRERPSIHKLPMFCPVVTRHLHKESKETRNQILSNIFPHYFHPETGNRCANAFSDLEESHELIEETHGDRRSSEFGQQNLDNGDDTTSNPPNLISGPKSPVDMLGEVNRSDKRDHKSLKEEIYQLPLAPYIPYLRSSKAVLEPLDPADRLKQQKIEDDIVEELVYAIGRQEDPDQDPHPECNLNAKRKGQPAEKKNEDLNKTTRSDRTSKQDDPPICILCDDGGDLLGCDGPCKRFFHPVKDVSGKESYCETLGMTMRQVKGRIKFYCKNCQYQKHQCFICGELGSSKASSILGHQEVFLCRASSCKRYYHPECVARDLISTADWKTLAEKIQRGQEGFQCPRHCCRVCETEELNPGDLVQCRRCPKAWHLDCLQDCEFSNELPGTQVWNHFKRSFIFCKAHKILPQLQTPVRNHFSMLQRRLMGSLAGIPSKGPFSTRTSTLANIVSD